MRHNYWSCTPFAQWVRKTFGGYSQPSHETATGWKQWRQKSKIDSPLTYWFVEEKLDKLQNLICWPCDKIMAVANWIHACYVLRHHVIRTQLRAGEWYEHDQRLLHGVFSILVDYVEVDCAWIHVVFSADNMRKYGVPKWRTNRFLSRFGTWRCSEAGVDHLKWAASLTYTDDWVDMDSPLYGTPTPQAKAAKEILELYQWWTVSRPTRPDPYSAVKWDEVCRSTSDDDFLSSIDDPTTFARKNQALIDLGEIEKQYDDEDTKMLTRVIALRRDLWT